MRAKRPLRRVASFLVLSAAVVALAGCDVVVGGLNAQGKAQDEWVRSFPINGDGKVEIVNGNGTIEVTAAEGNTVEVRVERIAHATTDDGAKEMLKQLEIRADADPGLVRLETRVGQGSGSRRHFEVRYHVKVPARVAVTARNSNGKVDLTGLSGDVVVESANGTITGSNLSGAVDANTINGQLTLDMASLAAGGVKAETVNGRIRLALPSDAKATLKAACLHGRIEIDRKLNVKNELENDRRRFEGKLNGGGPKIEVDTTNGAVEISGR
jgi:DUF4097 and DUF4098 domain-containing protein YvlB